MADETVETVEVVQAPESSEVSTTEAPEETTEPTKVDEAPVTRAELDSVVSAIGELTNNVKSLVGEPEAEPVKEYPEQPTKDAQELTDADFDAMSPHQLYQQAVDDVTKHIYTSFEKPWTSVIDRMNQLSGMVQVLDARRDYPDFNELRESAQTINQANPKLSVREALDKAREERERIMRGVPKKTPVKVTAPTKPKAPETVEASALKNVNETWEQARKRNFEKFFTGANAPEE